MPEQELLLEVIKTSVSRAQVLYHEHFNAVLSGHLALKSSKYTASELSLQSRSQKCFCCHHRHRATPSPHHTPHLLHIFGFLNWTLSGLHFQHLQVTTMAAIIVLHEVILSPNLLCFLQCEQAKLPQHTSHLPTKILRTDPQGLSNPIPPLKQNVRFKKIWKVWKTVQKITSPEAVAGKLRIKFRECLRTFLIYLKYTEVWVFQMNHKCLSFCNIPLKASFCMAKSNFQSKAEKEMASWMLL